MQQMFALDPDTRLETRSPAFRGRKLLREFFDGSTAKGASSGGRASKIAHRLKKYGGHIDLRDAPRRVPSSQGRYGYQARIRGRVWGILKRFLHRRVGTSWNEIYSEACRRAKYRSRKGWVILKSLRDLVDYNVQMDTDGHAWQVVTRKFQQRTDVHGFFVNPLTGLLGWQNPLPVKPLEAMPTDETKTITEDLIARKHNGIWYLQSFRYHRPDEIAGHRWSKVESHIPIFYRDLPREKARYLYKTKQANKQELRDYGLINDRP